MSAHHDTPIKTFSIQLTHDEKNVADQVTFDNAKGSLNLMTE